MKKQSKQNNVVVRSWDSYEEYSKIWEKEFKERHNKLDKKIKDFFTYSIGWKLREKWNNVKYYFKNLIAFQPILKSWRPWDYHYTIDLFVFGLNSLADYMEKYGHEIDLTRKKKIVAIRSLVAEINRDYEDELCEKYDHLTEFRNSIKKITEYENGSISWQFKDDEETKKKNDAYHKRLVKERKQHYDKIFKLIIGQDEDKLRNETDRKYEEMMANLPEKEREDMHRTKYYDVYSSLYDGSGIEGWWD